MLKSFNVAHSIAYFFYNLSISTYIGTVNIDQF
ncbi:hypothetical protein QE382_004462 [Sphingobacterium zeae]|uniref:Uncharacterized protein n=1 Tax=Sphingobacterium zeae TaxID=1776859 RepID=A0ABU0UC95_9SPHI|nr:hypothetical protein [Sphingobacterium zeae]